jgi:hypothetical protein
MALLCDWRLAWVLPAGRWDEDGAAIVAEALQSGDWGTVVEFAVVIEWDAESAC